ncbi:2-oxoacid:acceptor oxidoreductase subunit alpha [Blastopirellula marina]|uniref:2-oxoglutarate ferredoxin oxidoreductase subunit alpha n=1 Tax=Blastopirellula marina TaxID=124 RepID=A0A2S8GC89_9BACT|nr:2-oxoacid:acceptor oxidoreductase subunit alpha [Blastopirellula marina]PQO42049.1 2-oxoglutarate ferredoxin oxidoreductase subunit alpha [Blastopirellula marina]
MSTTTEDNATPLKEIQPLEEATVRFCGDSGDGMQLAGTQFSNTSALAGNDVATFPDFPAEIRAPRGTLAGVSGFQIHFASHDIYTPGELVDALVAMNPAALKTNLADLKSNGVLIINSDAFDKKSLGQAGYETNPIEDDSLSGYQVFAMPMTSMTRGAVEGLDLSVKESDRCRNFFAMGLVFWLYGRSMEPTLRFIDAKFSKLPNIAEANRRALKAGYNFGETTDAFRSSYKVDKAKLPKGTYRNMTGNQALAWGLMSAAKLSDKKLFLGSYPITPASDILHELSKYKHYNVLTFQAEDEIAAVCAAIGAAYGGEMALTTTSGPGMALKGEAMGLAMMMELPLVIVDVQRGGPSTGLPTKTEQADLMQAIFGRNGESPIPVIAGRSPADCFDVAIEAWRIATRFMTPIIILTDGYIANGSEPWRIPKMEDLPKIEIKHPGPRNEDDPPFMAYQRDEQLARPWAIPGTPGLMHRLGGLEKQDGTGNVSYDPQNHHHMVKTRAQKVANIADFVPEQEVMGAENGKVLVLSWGGTYGSCRTAVARMQAQGKAVSHAHLRYLNPFPRNLGKLLSSFDKVLIPELNLGQLRMLIRDKYLVDAVGLNKVQGKPFATTEIAEKIESLLG